MRQVSTFVDSLVNRLLKLRNRHFLVIDVLVLLLTPSIALMLRTESIVSVQTFGVSLAILSVRLQTFLIACMRQVSTFVDSLVNRLLKLRNRHFLVIDVLVLLLTPSIALMLRTESIVSVQTFGVSLAILTVVFLIVKVLIFRRAGLYNRYWKYASIDELAKITLAVIGAVAVQAVVFLFIVRPLGWIDLSFPRSIPFIDGLLTLFVVGGTRYSMRFAQRVQQRVRPNGNRRRVLVIGAGTAGIMMVREMRHNPHLGLYPVAFVDDDPEKQGMRIHGLDVLGGHEDIPALVKDQDADLIIIAIARASGMVVREMVFDKGRPL